MAEWAESITRNLSFRVGNLSIMLNSSRGCPSNPECMRWVVVAPPLLAHTPLEVETEEDAKFAALTTVEAALRKLADDVRNTRDGTGA